MKNGELTGGGVPCGTVISYAGTNPPNGWLICNGQAVSRTTYANLFSAIGTTYGKGNGSTTFNVPNLIGRFIESGVSNQVGTTHEAGLPNITGSFKIWKFNDYLNGAFSTTFMGEHANTHDGGSDPDWKVYFDASKSNSIYGKSSTVQPASLILLPIIKAV